MCRVSSNCLTLTSKSADRVRKRCTQTISYPQCRGDSWTCLSSACSLAASASIQYRTIDGSYNNKVWHGKIFSVFNVFEAILCRFIIRSSKFGHHQRMLHILDSCCKHFKSNVRQVDASENMFICVGPQCHLTFTLGQPFVAQIGLVNISETCFHPQ